MTMMTLPDVQWACLVGLFLSSLLVVLAWLVQYSLAVLRSSSPRDVTKTPGHTSWQLPSLLSSHRTQAGGVWGGSRAGTGGVWGSLLRLRSAGRGGGGGPASEAGGVKGLLTALFSFKSFREKWQKAWVQALNQQACRHGSSLQVTFDDNLQLPASAEIDSVTCTEQSAHSMVLQCNFAVDTVTFPVTVTRQSPAAVSMATYQICIEPAQAQLLVRLEEVEEAEPEKAGLLVTWSFVRQPSFSLNVRPRRLHRENTDAEADLDLIGELVEDSLFSTHPAMMLNLKTCASSPALLCLEAGDRRGDGRTPPLCSSLTPTRKGGDGDRTVDVDRTVMPDGTIVTTVTTIQSRLKQERKPGDSPARSPSKGEVTEMRGLMVASDSLHSRASSSPSPSRESSRGDVDSPLSNGLDPVADTAIRQLTESAGRAARKTPTKRSTLIISGVSKVPVSEDDSALSSGYAAAMDAALLGGGASSLCGGGASVLGVATGSQRDADETTPSDASERPSVEDAESETGSTGALETRSLKDHKVGFLRSGTKLLFRRKHRQKDPGVSQSHEDVSSLENNSASSSGDAPAGRKNSGSFSRRLIKRFSFRSSSFRSSSSSKSKDSANANANANANGGGPADD